MRYKYRVKNMKRKEGNGNGKRNAIEDQRNRTEIRPQPMFAMVDRVVTAITISTGHMNCLKYLLWLHPLVTLYQYHWRQPRLVAFLPKMEKKRGNYHYGVPLRQPPERRIPVNTINSAMGRILSSQILEMHSIFFPVLLYIQGILSAGSSFLNAFLHATSIWIPMVLLCPNSRGIPRRIRYVCISNTSSVHEPTYESYLVILLSYITSFTGINYSQVKIHLFSWPSTTTAKATWSIIINLYTIHVHATCKRNVTSSRYLGIYLKNSNGATELYHATQLFRCPSRPCSS